MFYNSMLLDLAKDCVRWLLLFSFYKTEEGYKTSIEGHIAIMWKIWVRVISEVHTLPN